MSTLLLRLAAPLQAWGLEDKFERRGTMREPTKSGVIGMLAAALGIGRDDFHALNALAALRFGVRIDQPGELLSDFHTARALGRDNPYVTRRSYLADAVFLAGVEGDDELLLKVERALKNPVYPLFLGRRCCPPEGKLSLGLKDAPLENALRDERWQAGMPYKLSFKRRQAPLPWLTLVLDAQSGILRRRDVPVSYSQEHRKHALRFVDDLPNAVNAATLEKNAEHDAWSALEAIEKEAAPDAYKALDIYS